VPHASRKAKTKAGDILPSALPVRFQYGADLPVIIEAWQTLPAEIQAAIAAIVKANRLP
jgi:hypothetical protein